MVANLRRNSSPSRGWFNNSYLNLCLLKRLRPRTIIFPLPQIVSMDSVQPSRLLCADCLPLRCGVDYNVPVFQREKLFCVSWYPIFRRSGCMRIVENYLTLTVHITFVGSSSFVF